MSVQLIYMADVFCPWCFGFAPIMGRIAKENPEFPVKVVGGNLISQPLSIADDYAANPGLVDFWKQVEKTVNRSLEGAIQAALTGKEVRMFSPGADEILMALREFAPGNELAQLFYLEDLFFLKGENMFSEASLNETASHWKIPAAKFEKALDSEAAIAATKRNLAEAANLLGEAGSYPSLFVAKDNEAYAVTQGYVHYETAASRLASVLRNLDLEPLKHLGCSFAGDCTTGQANSKR